MTIVGFNYGAVRTTGSQLNVSKASPTPDSWSQPIPDKLAREAQLLDVAPTDPSSRSRPSIPPSTITSSAPTYIAPEEADPRPDLSPVRYDDRRSTIMTSISTTPTYFPPPPTYVR
jgi:hypothetical protein